MFPDCRNATINRNKAMIVRYQIILDFKVGHLGNNLIPSELTCFLVVSKFSLLGIFILNHENVF